VGQHRASQNRDTRFVAVDLGSPADVHTSEGSADGFVVGTCELDGYRVFYVQGLGQVRALSKDPNEWTPEAMERARALLGAAPTSGFGRGCNGGGVNLWVDHYRKVDAVIEAVGASLRSHGLADTVTVRVSPTPVTF
jgi:hypothetical protein